MQNIEKDELPTKVPVLRDIAITGEFFFLNSLDYSAYPEEQEVLIQEGIRYRVISVDQAVHSIKVDEKYLEQKLIIVKLRNIKDKYKRMNCFKRSVKYLTS